jgi:hypothetical protein
LRFVAIIEKRLDLFFNGNEHNEKEMAHECKATSKVTVSSFAQFLAKEIRADEEHAYGDYVALFNLLEATTSYSVFITMMQGEGD